MNISIIKCCPVCNQNYDTARNSKCPYCSQIVLAPSSMADKVYERTVDLKPQLSSDLLENTVALDVSYSEEDNDVTIGASLSATGSKQGEISGWLVCVAGPDYGRDYRIRYNYNYIGRDMDMDICIASDRAIHKQKHVAVVYEPTESLFYCVPNGGSICYLNGATITKPTIMNDYDRLKIGNTELVFRSFCGEGYKW